MGAHTPAAEGLGRKDLLAGYHNEAACRTQATCVLSDHHKTDSHQSWLAALHHSYPVTGPGTDSSLG